MTLHVDLYYSMRSPYSYLSIPQLQPLIRKYDLAFNLRPVYPLAVNDPNFFQRVDPLFLQYLIKDTVRIAKRLNVPFNFPRPDPIIQNYETRKVADQQPYIRNLTHLAQAAAETDMGLEFVSSVSKLLFNPDIDGWNTGNHLKNAITEAGIDFDALMMVAKTETERLESATAENRKNQLNLGHWGTPLFVHKGEVFFGQDRIVDLIWHLENNGLIARNI